MKVYDDFTLKSEYWIIREDGYAKIDIGDSLARLSMGPTEALYYSNAELSDGEFNDLKWHLNTMEITVRLDRLHLGSAGWGFWNHSMVVDESYPIWFIYLNSPGKYPLKGFFIQVGGLFKPIMLIQPLTRYYIGLKLLPFIAPIKILSYKPVYREFNLSKWHVYRIEWGEEDIRFSIDGEVVGIVSNYRPWVRCRADIWIDNAVFNPPSRNDSARVYRHITHENRVETRLEIDNIKIE